MSAAEEAREAALLKVLLAFHDEVGYEQIVVKAC